MNSDMFDLLADLIPHDKFQDLMDAETAASKKEIFSWLTEREQLVFKVGLGFGHGEAISIGTRYMIERKLEDDDNPVTDAVCEILEKVADKMETYPTPKELKK